MSNYGKNMLVVKTSLMGMPNFTLIPLTLDCPYAEAIFEPNSKNLIVFSKVTQTRFRMLTRLNENGDPVTPKKPRPNKESTAEERKQMESLMEHYIADVEDIKSFVTAFAVNPERVELDSFLAPKPELSKV